jgi:lipoate synthase
MSPRSKLEPLYQQWHDLTTAETHAIESETWEALADCQRRKEELKRAILNENASGGPRPPELRTWLQALMDMERHNLETVGRHLTLLRQQIAGLDASSRTLHRIKGAYARQTAKVLAGLGTA